MSFQFSIILLVISLFCSFVEGVTNHHYSLEDKSQIILLLPALPEHSGPDPEVGGSVMNSMTGMTLEGGTAAVGHILATAVTSDLGARLTKELLTHVPAAGKVLTAVVAADPRLRPVFFF